MSTPKVRISLYPAQDLHDKVEELAESSGRSVSNTYEMLVSQGKAVEGLSQEGYDIYERDPQTGEETLWLPKGGTLGTRPRWRG